MPRCPEPYPGDLTAVFRLRAHLEIYQHFQLRQGIAGFVVGSLTTAKAVIRIEVLNERVSRFTGRNGSTDSLTTKET